MNSLAKLPAFDRESGALQVVIETSKGSRNKITFDRRLGLFALSGVLPAGASFPYDFGFVPSTLGDDGDPLDVLLMLDEPVFAGCLVRARLIGAIAAMQCERDGDLVRNDRLIAVAEKSRTHEEVHALTDLADSLLHQLEHFFISYNQEKGLRFEVTGREDPTAALAIVRRGQRRHRDAARRRARK